MRKRISVVFLISLFALFIFVGGALGATDAKKVDRFVPVPLPVDGAQPPGEYTGPSPVFYELGKQPDCEDINPPDPPIVIIQHEQMGATHYDYQKNGSMGRMIAASSDGNRHMVFHETSGDYTTFPRFVTHNCKNPASAWCGPLQMDGGPGNQAGYAQMALMHDGTEIIIYHRGGGGAFAYHSSLARGEYGYPCQCYITKKYDVPDEHDNPAPGTTEGYWPKGCVVYGDTDYIHIVTTQSTGGTGSQTNAYQRCYFVVDTLYCESPGYGPYTMTPGTHCGTRNIAVIDEIHTISSIAVSSPVSKKVAIVYTKNREDAQVNNDVVYIESDSNGTDWLSGTQWPPTLHNITNYPGDASGPRAYTDVAACYDYNDSLHIVWNAHYYDTAAGTVTYRADLYHWSKEHQITMIAAGPEPVLGHEIHPGAWNRTISKPSISAKDPIYHPGHEPEEPDSVFLFVTWTQFNLDDLSADNMTNGDIYVAASNDAGKLWTYGYNLTNTKTPDCLPGACLSEHWSSMAKNMHNGDLHIEYVCDRDAGGIVQDEGTWTDNPMMYLHVAQFEVMDACGAAYELIDPPNWCDPPIKVSPDVTKYIELKLRGLYNIEGDYAVTTDHAKVACQSNCDGELNPGETRDVGLVIDCAGAEVFINATVLIHVCIGSEFDTTFEVTVHAVCSDDYYECPRDPATYIEKDNETLKLKAWANTQQQVWDYRVLDTEDEIIQPIFSGGVVVCTHEGADTVAGRQDYSDNRTGARDTINVVESSVAHPDEEPECIIQMIYVKDTYICANHLEPPNHVKWWWIDIHKKIIMFHDRPGFECPEWKKEQIIKKVWIDYSEPPGWWPTPGAYPGHEDICFGYFADVDAPFDTGGNGWNSAGYDAARELVWLHGYNAESHPEYEDYHVGLAFTDVDGNIVNPFGVHVVRNDSFIYPQGGWGWKDAQLCSLMCTPTDDADIQDAAIDTFDRTVVMTAEVIPQGSETDFFSHFILIEAFIPDGLGALQTHIDDTRAILIPELRDLGVFFQDPADPPHKIFPICGDINEDGAVNVADAVYLVTYLFQYGPAPSWPMNRADVNSDVAVNVADLVFLVTYLFQYGPAPQCSGFGR